MTVPFDEYLEAKCELDNRSLNATVNRSLIKALAEQNKIIRCLDVGTGTGAVINRLIGYPLDCSMTLIGLDQQVNLLKIAQEKIRKHLKDEGYTLRCGAKAIHAQRAGQKIFVCFEPDSVEHYFEHGESQLFDLITAQAVMDLLPLLPTLKNFAARLKEHGLFCATLNYDGDTTLLPVYTDRRFEAALLNQYNASMEARRVKQRATGGSYSGRRLHDAVKQSGFGVIAVGSSDWNMTPVDGDYLDHDEVCLRALLAIIRQEGKRAANIEPAMLSQWYRQRMELLDQKLLGIIVHQLDILARKNYE